MEIRNRSDGTLTTVNAFKATKPNTSFPKPLSEDCLNDYGYDVVLDGNSATITAPYEVNTRDGVEEISGKWYTKFVAGPIFTDTKDDSGNVITTAAENENTHKACIDLDKGTDVRRQRDADLASTDWTQLADSQLSNDDKAKWVTYRQELRDVPTQAGFPHTVTWPTKPT